MFVRRLRRLHPRRRSITALLLTLLATGAASAIAAAPAQAEEMIVQPSTEQLRAALFASESVSELTSLQASKNNVNATLPLLKAQLIDRVNEIQPLAEASATELEGLLGEVHAANSGETLGSAIQDFDAVMQQLHLGESPEGMTPLRRTLRAAAKYVGKELLEEAQYARPGNFEPYTQDLLWWGFAPEKTLDPYTAVEQAFRIAQSRPAVEDLLGNVLGETVVGRELPKTHSPIAALIAAAAPTAARLAESTRYGATLKEFKTQLDEARKEALKSAQDSTLQWEADPALGQGQAEADAVAVDGASEAEQLGNLVGEDTGVFSRLGAAADEGAAELARVAGTIAGEAALDIVGSLADPALAVTAILEAPTIITQLIDLFSNTPSPEQILLEQIQQVKEMIVALSIQVAGGLQHVDAGLETLSLQLEEDTQLLENIGAHIGTLSNDVAQIEEKLHQLQADLFEIAKTQREETLVADLDTDIGYSERTPGDTAMPLTQFEQAAGTFFAWGSFDPTDPLSELPSGAWPSQPSEIAATLGTATSTDTLDFNLDFLADYADERQWGDGLKVSPSLPNPAVWADGASAFAQLLVENPEDATAPLRADLGRLSEIGTLLREELGIVSEMGSKYGAQSVDGVNIDTGSSIINHALANYLELGPPFLNRIEAQENAFLASQDPGKEAEPNCAKCQLGTAPDRFAPGDTGMPNIELWGSPEQKPSPSLTTFGEISPGTQPEEGGRHAPGEVNECKTSEYEEAISLAYPGLIAGGALGATPGPLALTGAELDPLPAVYANAWHLGLGYLTSCYVAGSIPNEGFDAAAFPQYKDRFGLDVIWFWHDNETGAKEIADELTMWEPKEPLVSCEFEHPAARLQDLWTLASAEGSSCKESAKTAPHYQEIINTALGSIGTANRINCPGVGGLPGWEVCVLPAGAKEFEVGFVQGHPEYEFDLDSKLSKEVSKQLKSLRAETYEEIAPPEDPALNSGGQDPRKASDELDGARALLDDYIEIGLPVSVAEDPTLGKFLFGPGHLLDDSPPSYEVFKYLIEEIEKAEATAEANHQPLPGDPAQKEGTFEARMKSEVQELAAQLKGDIEKDGRSSQVTEGDQVIPSTLARLDVANFALAAEEAPKLTVQPVSASVVEPASASFTAESTGQPKPEIQWEVSTDGGHTFSPDTSDAGNNGNTLKIEDSKLSESGNEYRASFKNEVGSATSKPATLTVIRVERPTLTAQPLPVTVVEPATASFTSEASGYPKPTVQWEVSTNGGVSFSPDIADLGNTTDTLKVGLTNVLENGYEYRAKFENEIGSATSEPATLTVHKPPTPEFTIIDEQQIKGSGSGFTKGDLTGALGETVEYVITVTDSGNVPLTLSHFSDLSCVNIAAGPAPSPLAPGDAASYSCERALSHVGTYTNEASVEATPPEGEGSALTHTSNELVAIGPSPSPTVETENASQVGQRTALLNATVNPHGGKVTSCKFEYGTGVLSSSEACSKLPGAGTTAVAVSASLAGLQPGTTYYFRISAASASGTDRGSESSFKTLPAAAPAVETKPASELGQRTALLNATVNPKAGTITNCTFEYGTTGLANSVPCSKLPGAGSSPVAVSALVKGLSPDKSYFFRISATSASGTSHGSITTFETALAFAPTVVTLAAAEVAAHGAVLNATVDPNGAEVTICRFEYGTTSLTLSVPCSKGPGLGTSAVAVSATLKSLASNTTYHFQISATSASGTSKGIAGSFKT